VAVLLSGEDVADVDFDGGGGYGGDGVMYSDARVAVSSGVDDDSVGGEPHLVNAVDDFAFDVALVIAYLRIGIVLAQCFDILFHGNVAVDFGLTESDEVEVWSVYDFYLFHAV